MKKYKNKIFKAATFISVVVSYLFLFSGCKKANEYEKTNIYDRNYKGTRNYNYSMTSTIIKETYTTSPGLLSQDEFIYYHVTITNNGPDPAPFNNTIKFSTNYTGSGITSSQSSYAPVDVVVNGFLIESGTSVTPLYTYPGHGVLYSFRIGNPTLPVPAGTNITVYCTLSDVDGNEVFKSSFIVTCD